MEDQLKVSTHKSTIKLLIRTLQNTHTKTENKTKNMQFLLNLREKNKINYIKKTLQSSQFGKVLKKYKIIANIFLIKQI